MSLNLPTPLVKPMVAGLLGGIDVENSPPDEQLLVLSALANHLWNRPDLDLSSLTPLSPSETAAQIPDALVRRRFHESHMTLEAGRHRQSKAQVGSVETYAQALGTPGEDLVLFRTFIEERSERASQDSGHVLSTSLANRAEPSFAELPIDADHAEPELAERLLVFSELPNDSLGRAFLAYYERHGLSIRE